MCSIGTLFWTLPYGATCCVWLDHIQNRIAADSHVFLRFTFSVDFHQCPGSHGLPPLYLLGPEKARARESGSQFMFLLLKGLIFDHAGIETMEPLLGPRHGLAILS